MDFHINLHGLSDYGTGGTQVHVLIYGERIKGMISTITGVPRESFCL